MENDGSLDDTFIKYVFAMYAIDEKVSKRNLINCLQSMGMVINKEYMDEILSHKDFCDVENFDFEQILNIKSHFRHIPDDNDLENICKIIDCDGKLSNKDMKDILLNYGGSPLSNEELCEFMNTTGLSSAKHITSKNLFKAIKAMSGTN
ncbi:MAG: hypothetical protein MHMPM18_000202 [Marteilia pararefringens]